MLLEEVEGAAVGQGGRRFVVVFAAQPREGVVLAFVDVALELAARPFFTFSISSGEEKPSFSAMCSISGLVILPASPSSSPRPTP